METIVKGLLRLILWGLYMEEKLYIYKYLWRIVGTNVIYEDYSSLNPTMARRDIERELKEKVLFIRREVYIMEV